MKIFCFSPQNWSCFYPIIVIAISLVSRVWLTGHRCLWFLLQRTWAAFGLNMHVFAKDSNKQIRKLLDLGFSVHWVWKHPRSGIFLSLSAQLALTPFSPLGFCDILVPPYISDVSLFFTGWLTWLLPYSYNYSHGTVFFLVCSQYSHSGQTSSSLLCL